MRPQCLFAQYTSYSFKTTLARVHSVSLPTRPRIHSERPTHHVSTVSLNRLNLIFIQRYHHSMCPQCLLAHYTSYSFKETTTVCVHNVSWPTRPPIHSKRPTHHVSTVSLNPPDLLFIQRDRPSMCPQCLFAHNTSYSFKETTPACVRSVS